MIKKLNKNNNETTSTDSPDLSAGSVLDAASKVLLALPLVLLGTFLHFYLMFSANFKLAFLVIALAMAFEAFVPKENRHRRSVGFVFACLVPAVWLIHGVNLWAVLNTWLVSLGSVVNL